MDRLGSRSTGERLPPPFSPLQRFTSTRSRARPRPRFSFLLPTFDRGKAKRRLWRCVISSRERDCPRPFPQRRRWKDERIGNWWTVRDRSESLGTTLEIRRNSRWRGGPLNALESNGEESRDSGTCQKIRAPFSGWRQKPNAHLFEPRCRVYAYIHVGQT